MTTMITCVYLMACLVIVRTCKYDPSQAFFKYKEETMGTITALTTSSGYLVSEEESSVLNSNLIRNPFFMDFMSHFDQEKIPERTVHAPGVGAMGYFEVTHNISNICRAKLFSQIGKKTKVAVRFSVTSGSRGTSDTVRDIRGFAIKFYTEEGNFDMVGVSTPAFSVKDPLYFPSSIHASNTNPVNNIFDPNMEWDFFTQRIENRVFLLNLMSDRSTPDGFRHMPGYSIHTYQVENECGEPSFVRFHVIPDAGIKNLNNSEAIRLAGADPDYNKRGLYNAIAKGNPPSWTVGLQILSMDDVKKAPFDPFDVTKILPTDIYPIQKIGKLVLDENPLNFFASIEQLAFCPANLVPGILGAPDKLFEARMFSYRDSHNYRVGINANKIIVNRPLSGAATYNREGKAPVGTNENNAPNYFPNSFNGLRAIRKDKSRLIKITQNASGNLEQAREYYKTLTEAEKSSLPDNIASAIITVEKSIQDKVIRLFSEIDPKIGEGITQSLQKTSC